MPSFFSDNALATFMSQGNFILAIVATLVAGFLTALSPCVYPIIPITLSVIGARRYESALQGFTVSLFYVAGMIVLYVGLGILFSSLGILFGNVFRHPFVLIGVGLLFLFFSLSMFGATNWILPQSLLTRLSHFGGSGLKGAFFMGLVSGLIASPCTGPVLAFILTLISKEGNLAKGSVLMIAFGIGMGFPFLLLGTFSSFLARIPKSGAWMNRIKFVFGIVMLLVGGYFIALGIQPSFKQSGEVAKSELTWVKVSATDDAYEQLQNTLEAFASQGRPVMIDFYADWCVACGELEKSTFQDPRVVSAFDDFGLIRVDLTSSNASLDRIEREFEIVGLPLLVFYDRSGKIMAEKKVFGFLNADAFLKHLEGLPTQNR